MSKDRNVRAPKSIDVIRLRPGMFIGDDSNCDHLIHECIDNFLDELRNNFGNSAGISFGKTGMIKVFDDGRGLPIGEAIDEETKQKVDSIELIFSKLHSGTKFSLDDDKLDSLFGQNGVGLVAVNALSELVDVKTKNKTEAWHYQFKDGLLSGKEKCDPPKYSTEIIFKPNPKYFGSIVPNKELFYERLKLAQAKLPKATFLFNNKPVKKLTLEQFARQKLNLSKETPIFYTSYKTNIEYTEAGNSEKIKKPANIDVYLTYESGDTIVQGDVNLRFCEGTYLNALQNLIKSLIPNKLDKKFQKAPERFFLEGLRLYASLQYPVPKFDSQTKTRLICDVKSTIVSPMENKINKILSDPYIKETVEDILSQKEIKSIKYEERSDYMNPYPFTPFPIPQQQILEELKSIKEQLMSIENKLENLTNKSGKNYLEKDDNYYII